VATIEQARALVEPGETYRGQIIPTERAEIDRPVRVGKGATVTGGLYGETVTVGPDTLVGASVMASNEIELGGGEVDGEVGTPGAVEGNGAHVHGTVTGSYVDLTDCVVRGNVVGTEVTLEDCTVLGVVSGERQLTLRSTVCHTFKSQREATLDDAAVVLPQAIANGSVTLESPVEVRGFGQSEGFDTGAGEGLELTRADLVTDDGVQYLTLAPRLLDLDAVGDRLDDLTGDLRAVVAKGAGSDGTELNALRVTDVPDATSIDDIDVDRGGPPENEHADTSATAPTDADGTTSETDSNRTPSDTAGGDDWEASDGPDPSSGSTDRSDGPDDGERVSDSGDGSAVESDDHGSVEQEDADSGPTSWPDSGAASEGDGYEPEDDPVDPLAEALEDDPIDDSSESGDGDDPVDPLAEALEDDNEEPEE